MYIGYKYNINDYHLSNSFNILNYDNIIYLNCNGNNLNNKLPILPNNLIELYCSISNLNYLSILPKYLKYLGCSYNSLINLPLLPNNLK